MSNYHIPVLLQEVLRALRIQKDAKYIDATVGGGGHTFEILKYGGNVLGLDVDEDALEHVQEELRINSLGSPLRGNYELRRKITTVRGNFKDIDTIAKRNGFEKVAGILFDFGVSSFQLETAEKGFSFMQSGPLDMRMDTTLPVSARDLINGLSRGELYELFTKLGEERNAKRIAQEICTQREKQTIETTDQLVRVIEKAFGVTNEVISQKRRAEMCMRVFQGLRMCVNDELGVIKDALPKAVELLSKNGRMAVISFHSLEDRIVKQTFLDFERKGIGKIITKKPLVAAREERDQNRRSRSAKLRVFEKGQE